MPNLTWFGEIPRGQVNAVAFLYLEGNLTRVTKQCEGGKRFSTKEEL